LPLACAAAISELEAAGAAVFELAGLTAVAAVFAGALGAGFAAGAAACVLEAGAAAGAAAGALAAVVSSAFLLFRDFFAVVAEVSLLAAGALEALVSAASFLLFRDFLEVVADVSLLVLLAALLSSLAALSFFDFLDFFFVVELVLLVSLEPVELDCAAAITGMKASVNATDKTAIHRLSLYREFIILLFPHKLRGTMPRILRIPALNLAFTKRLRRKPQKHYIAKVWWSTETARGRPEQEAPNLR